MEQMRRNLKRVVWILAVLILALVVRLFWQAIGYLFPSTPGIQGFIRINTCGAALNEVVHEYHTLWIQAGAYFVLALVIYRFQIIRSRKMIIKQHRYMKMKQTF